MINKLVQKTWKCETILKVLPSCVTGPRKLDEREGVKERSVRYSRLKEFLSFFSFLLF